MKDPNATQRERLAAHRNSTACAGCHAMMDPIGFVFEGYDPSGRFRSTEYGKAIDVSGRVEGTDVEGDFNGPAELAKKIVSSTQAHECIINTWFRFANGRGETDADLCSEQQIGKSFTTSGLSMRELVLSLTQSDAFLYRVKEMQ